MSSNHRADFDMGATLDAESCNFVGVVSICILPHSSPASGADAVALMGWPGLGCAEILATPMFLIPKLERTGGLSLLVIFGIAAALHILHGQYQIGSLFVYGAAVLCCISPSGGNGS